MHPERSTTVGTLARRGAAWAVLIVAGLLALKVVASILVGVVQAIVTVVMLAALAFAVIWALRRL